MSLSSRIQTLSGSAQVRVKKSRKAIQKFYRIDMDAVQAIYINTTYGLRKEIYKLSIDELMYRYSFCRGSRNDYTYEFPHHIVEYDGLYFFY